MTINMANILNIQKTKADSIGIVASGLCLIHCIATPFLFIAKACTASCCASASVPSWWKLIDYLFLVISFLAIYYATKKLTKKWVQLALWGAWIILLFTVLNETLGFISIPESFIYFPALSIVILHFYNHKYCTCKDDNCCAE